MFKRRRRNDSDALFDAAKVDLVALTSDESAVELYIVQANGWTGTDDQLRSLQEKIHAYVGYAVDGQLFRDYPDTQGLPWQIVLDCQTGAPDPRSAEMLATLVESVRRYGGGLRTAVRDT